jgi:microcystin-dependent protein
MFAGNFAPSGWALCNGQLMSISQNAALFSIVGTYYGGNGTQTFALPDLRGRVALHQGQGPGLSPYVVGQVAGTENVTLLSNQMPIHTHLVSADGSAGGKTTPANNFPGTVSPQATEKIYSAGPGNTTMAPNMLGTAGGNQPFSIVQPYLCVTFIIALVGIFPSRN